MNVIHIMSFLGNIMKNIIIGEKKIGDGNPTFIIAEMAWSHDGSFDNAKFIVEAAAAAKSDAICIHLTSMPDYMVKDYSVTRCGASGAVNDEKLYDFLSKKNLSNTYWSEIIKRAKELGLAICVMCNDNASIDFALSEDVDAFVVPPASMNEASLLNRIAKSGKPVFLRIGGAYIDEIEFAIKHMSKFGTDRIALIYGFQIFPTPLDEMKIENIQFLKNKFLVPVGFADHTDAETGFARIVPAIAVAKGANVIEKHIIHNRCLKGLDFESALNPNEFKEMVENIRGAEQTFGKCEKYELSEKELNYRNTARKHAVASCELDNGAKVTYDNFSFKRANSGMYPDEFERNIGKKIKKSMKSDEPLTEDNIM